MINLVVGIATLLLGAAPLAQREPMPRGVYFPIGSLDRWGYVAWDDFGRLEKPLETALAHMKAGRFGDARQALLAFRKDNPANLVALEGLAKCALWQNRLPAFLNEIAKEAAGDTVSRTGISPKPYLALAFQYGLALISEETEQGRKINFNPADGRTPAGFYYGELYDDKRAFDSKNKVNCAMYVSALLANGDYMEARTAARAGLAVNPAYYQLRLMLAQALTRGIVGKSDGKNGMQPATPEERAQLTKAYAEASAVIKQAPSFTPAYYVAGYLASTIDKAKAKSLLTYYINHSADELRKKSARKILDGLNK